MSRILIVEDEPRIAAFLQKGLRAQGYDSAVAADGTEAVSMAGTHQFGLLILDLGLPAKDGMAVLRELRASGCDLPVVVVTAKERSAERLQQLQVSSEDYFTKPLRFEDLLARVRAMTPQEPAVAVGSGGLRQRLVAVVVSEAASALPAHGVHTAGAASGRHLVYSTAVADVTVDLLRKPDGTLRLHMQVLPLESEVGTRFEARLMDDGGEIASGSTDHLGRVMFDAVASGSYWLALRNDRLEIVVPAIELGTGELNTDQLNTVE